VRAKKLVQALAGSQERYDDALATQRSASAQLRSAHAAEQQSQINLDYTEIRAPIDGRIGRSSMTIGNVVGPGSGTLATIVSQDPMYVAFPVPVRTAIELRNRIAAKGGFDSVAIKVRLPDGSMYDHSGRLNFADVTIGPDTDSLILRGSFPNPVQSRMQLGASSLRALDDGAFVTVVVESATPVDLLALPREAVLSDQRGDFVYIVDAENTVERRSVQLGQSTPATAVISNGLAEGDRVVLEGLQRVQAGMKVAPSPADADTRAADATAASGS
jgi:membrane fusion protein, multidrug efflux system